MAGVGRVTKPRRRPARDRQQKWISELKREKRRLEQELAKARFLVDVQAELHALSDLNQLADGVDRLGIPVVAMPPLFGSVAAAVLTAPTTASVSDTGTTTPQPCAICLAASGTTLPATTNHELSLSGNKSSEIFDRTKESGETRQDR